MDGQEKHIKETLMRRDSVRKVLKQRIKQVGLGNGKGRGIDLPLLGVKDIKKSKMWILERILVDAPKEDVSEHVRLKLGVTSLVPSLIDLTPRNFEWLRGIHDSTLQSLSYIVNRMIESCRYDVPWEVEEAKPEEIVKALALLNKYEGTKRNVSTTKRSAFSKRGLADRASIEP